MIYDMYHSAGTGGCRSENWRLSYTAVLFGILSFIFSSNPDEPQNSPDVRFILFPILFFFLVCVLRVARTSRGFGSYVIP